MTRIVALIGALLLVGSFTTLVTKAQETALKGDLVLWHQMDPSEEELLTKLIEAFKVQYPEVTVEAVHYKVEDLRTNFQTAALASQGPTLVYGPADNVGVFATLKGGLIKPLDELLPAEFKASFLQGALDNFIYQGKIFGLPDRIGNHLMLIVNKELVQEGVASFETLFSSLDKYSKNLEDKDPANDLWPLAFNAKEPFWFIGFYGAFGGKVFSDANEPTLQNDAMVKALTFYKSLYDKKIIAKDLDYDSADTLFKEGKASMIINGDWSLANYQKTMKITTMPIPKVPGGEYPMPYTSSKGYSLNVHADENSIKLALTFLQFVLSQDNQKTWASTLNVLPANKLVFEAMKAGADEVVKGSMDQLAYGTPMPTIPEMRAVWDAIRPNLEGVLNGSKTPEAAAAAMQKEASEKIKTMKGE